MIIKHDDHPEAESLVNTAAAVFQEIFYTTIYELANVLSASRGSAQASLLHMDETNVLMMDSQVVNI
jgi:hypothetical protein